MVNGIKSVQDLNLKNRRVFIRVDFNVPLKNGANGEREVSDDARIRGALKTIQFVQDAGGRVILASHLGRPDGKPNAKYSLEPVGRRLSELLKQDVLLSDDCVGDGPRGLSQQLRGGQILLLENLRFHAGEEENSTDFVNRLQELCDVYVSDAFGALHRAHASTVGLPKVTVERAAGFLVQKELEFLQPLKEDPKRPFVLVMGGAKVTDKIGVLEKFLDRVDRVVIGGAMAYAFLKAEGHQIGKSLCDDKQVRIASKLIQSADARKIRLFLPKDHLVARSLDDAAGRMTDGVDIAEGFMGVDIGPKTIEYYKTAMTGAKTVFWNGPMGVFEKQPFSQGTFEMAKMIAATDALKLAGGGDSAAAIAQSGSEEAFSFVSTGGGATLEYLEGKELPGVKALETRGA